MRLDLLAALNAERAARRGAVVITELESGGQRLVRENETGSDALLKSLKVKLRGSKSGIHEHEGKRYFIEVHQPPLRIVVIGAVHVSQALSPMAKLLDYDLVIIDPRGAFATPARFPDVTLIADWPDNALPGLGLDPWTAFAAITHDPKIDNPALKLALEAGCFYVGALGSKKTHVRRMEALRQLGVSEAKIAEIHAPIGLNIGALTPPEIALAILAEITLRLRRGQEAMP
jgi:xanthine dehydrogenase accessory factor